MKLLDTSPNKLFTPKDAISTANMLNANDDEWTYSPVHDPKGTGLSFIVVHDEYGEYIGSF